MKIIIDDKIPFIRGVFEPFAQTLYIGGAKISAADVADADALIIRTRTICNAALLQNSKVKFIASATIGYDHIDTDFCRQNNIAWTNAAGCNSTAVAQFVLNALLELGARQNFLLRKKTIGIVGVGNVGKKVAQVCRAVGMRVLLCDPPRQQNEKNNIFSSLDNIAANADIITFHVPLIKSGEYKTFHLADNNFFNSIKAQTIINTSRGSVIETDALKHALRNKKTQNAIIDVWEHEPEIDTVLLGMVNIATPHIAGYSLDGKANGTTDVVRAASKFFNLGIDNWKIEDLPLPQKKLTIDCAKKTLEEILHIAAKFTYDINTDNNALKQNPEKFEQLRSDYNFRREFAAHNIEFKNATKEQLEILQTIGFNC